MSVWLLLILSALGFLGAFIAGLLGVGGAILMIPLLLYAPAWLGFPPMDVKTIAAISMVQVFFSAVSGVVAHGRRGTVHPELAITVGAVGALGSLAGGAASRWLHPLTLLAIFAVMATLGAILMWAIPLGRENEPAAAGPLAFRRSLAALVGGSVGFGAGLVGAGGAFLFVPLLIAVVGIPTRTTIGSSLAITLWTTAAGVVGKLVTGQIPFVPAAALIVGAIPGAQIGEWTSRRLGIWGLRRLLASLTTLVALWVWADVLSRMR